MVAEEEVRDLKHKNDLMHVCWLRDEGDHMAPGSWKWPQKDASMKARTPVLQP